MANGVTHKGAGIDSTIIQVSSGTGTITAMFWGNCIMSTITGFTASDMTIDFNASNQAWWNPGSGTGNCQGFLFPDAASYCTIQRVKFINMGSQNRESFPIFFGDGCSPGKGNVNHNTINECIFTQPIPKGNTNGGLTCINMTDAEPGITVDMTNIVSNCQFLNLAKPTYSDLAYTQCITGPVAINNIATSVDAFWYIEPGSESLGNNVNFTGETVQITGNTLTNVGLLALLNFTGKSTFAGNISIQNNMHKMSSTSYGVPQPYGVKVQTNYRGTVHCGAITITGNTFEAPPKWLNAPIAVWANAGAPALIQIDNLTVTNNVFKNFPQGDTAINRTAIQYTARYISSYFQSGNTFTSSSDAQRR
jgi:hypothetical protein